MHTHVYLCHVLWLVLLLLWCLTFIMSVGPFDDDEPIIDNTKISLLQSDSQQNVLNVYIPISQFAISGVQSSKETSNQRSSRPKFYLFRLIIIPCRQLCCESQSRSSLQRTRSLIKNMTHTLEIGSTFCLRLFHGASHDYRLRLLITRGIVCYKDISALEHLDAFT